MQGDGILSLDDDRERLEEVGISFLFSSLLIYGSGPLYRGCSLLGGSVMGSSTVVHLCNNYLLYDYYAELQHMHKCSLQMSSNLTIH